MDGWMSFLEWANISLVTVKTLIRGNLGILVAMAYMISLLSPFFIGFIVKNSLFRFRHTLGGEFLLNIKLTFASIIIPTILLFLIINNFNFFFSLNNTIITLAILSTFTFLFGIYIATFLYFTYLRVTVKEDLLPKDVNTGFHSIKKFLRVLLSSIFRLIRDTLKFILTSFILYLKNPKKSDWYLMYYTYLNKFNEEKLEKIKVSKLMVSLIIIWLISYLIVITFTTYSFLKLLV